MKYSAGYHVFLSLFFLVYHVQSISFEEAEEQIKELITWLKENGGKMNSKVDIKRIGNTTGFGVFANSDIPPKATLFKLPWNILLTGGTPVVGDHVTVNKNQQNQFVDAVITAYHEHDNTYGVRYTKTHTSDIVKSRDVSFYSGRGLECVTVANMVKEMKLGNDSKYAPFVNYLNSQQPGQLPSAWSVAGKKLLQEVLGENLPPTDPFQWSYQTYCGGPYDPFYENAAMLQLQRSWDDIMIPIFDLLNHRNGKWLNTHSDNIVPDVPVVIKSSREIKAGEEIYNTFNFCSDCNARFFGYGTPEILRDYGFVEQYPQLWYLPKMDINFEIEEDEVDSKRFRIKWLGQSRSQDFNLLDSDLQRLKLLNETKFSMTIKDVPQNEQTIIHEFVEAAIVAFTIALKGYRQECMNHGNSEADCRYDRLQHGPDPLNYNAYLCDFGLKFEFPDHLKVDEVQSPYQLMYINRNPHNKDTCFSLDHIYQICGSYRPHYHEMNVHYTARFLDQIKRVVWVGGGDSMLLHEIIKYPSLELVIGLEIDQTVTRKSFKHFGTQPHWDNDKVQWWYGDAAKSLLMLPKEYFGSFDMVLVDLSETVMSITVTKELDIMAALGLLLKPEGILVKNEIYFDKLSSVFEYTVQLHFYDVPVICSQALILGSNKIDFLARSHKDHNVQVLWDKHVPEINDTYTEDKSYEIWHDYRRNETHARLCQGHNEFEKEFVVQEASPGIVMILEAENVKVSLASTTEFVSLLTQHLSSVGVTIASTVSYPSNDEVIENSMIIIIFNSGYVVARTWPKFNYCAFDIHMWSEIEKQEKIKKKLISAVGSDATKESSSSYRIAAGGMFGVSTWKEDAKRRGPRYTDSCDDPDPISTVEPVSMTLYKSVLNETASLILEENINIAVICGEKETPCTSLEILKEIDKVRNVVEIRACSGVLEGDEIVNCEKEILSSLTASTITKSQATLQPFMKNDSLEVGDVAMASVQVTDSPNICTIRSVNDDGTFGVTFENGHVVWKLQRHLIKSFRSRKSVFDKPKIDAVVLDSGAPYIMGRIISKLLSVAQTRKTILKTNVFLLSLTENKNESWRRNMMDRFRTHYLKFDPIYFAEVLIAGKDSSLKIDILSSGDEKFIEHLKGIIPRIESSADDVAVNVENIQGGQFNFQPNFTPTNFYLPGDYDQSSPLSQWRSQRPLGRQTVFQLEKKLLKKVKRILGYEEKLNVGDVIEGNFEGAGDWYPGTILRANADNTYYIRYDDGDEEKNVEPENIRYTEEVKLIDTPYTPELFENALRKGIETTTQVCEQTCIASEVEIKSQIDLGEGIVLMSVWATGTLAVTWDGRNHVDINLFTLFEQREIHLQFISTIVKEIPSLTPTLRDTQPRGTGRVVNFSEDIEPRGDPHWI